MKSPRWAVSPNEVVYEVINGSDGVGGYCDLEHAFCAIDTA